MCGRTQSATVKVTVASLSQYYAGWTGPLYLPVHARPHGSPRLLPRVRLVLDVLELHLDPLRFLVQRARVEFRVEEELVDDLDHAGGGARARGGRVGPPPDSEQLAGPRRARDDAVLEGGHGVFWEEIHRLVRRADPVDLRLAVLLRRRLVHDETLRANEEGAPLVVRPVKDRRGDAFDHVRRGLELGDEHDDLVPALLLRPAIDPHGVHRLAVPKEGQGREVHGIPDADLAGVQ